MADDNTNDIDNTDQITQQATEQAVERVTAPVVKQAQAQNEGATLQSFQQLTDAINGLPEAVASAVAEVIPKPAKASPQPRTVKKEETVTTEHTTPNKKSFAEMWFN